MKFTANTEWRDTNFPNGSAETGDQFWLDATQVITDLNGFVYPGFRTDAILDTIKYFRARPDMVRKLIEEANSKSTE